MIRIARAAVAALAAVALLGGCGSSSAPSKLDATITVAGGKPKGGVQDLEVRKGGTVTFDFPAKIDGQFVIELEAAHQQLANLRVEP